MSIPLAVVLSLAIGTFLTYGATRATANVRHGRAFLRWMVVVFVAYIALMSLPVIVGF